MNTFAKFLLPRSSKYWADLEAGKEHYRWGEDLPEQCSEAFKLGWKLAMIQDRN